MWELTNWCFWKAASKNEIPKLITWIQSWLAWDHVIAKDNVLASMNSLILWVWWDSQWLPCVTNPSFVSIIEWNLNGVLELLNDND